MLRSSSEAVPAYLREIVDGKTIYINVLREMRPFALDYFRAAGAIVLDRPTAELQITSRLRSESATLRSGGLAGSDRRNAQRTIVEVELFRLRADGARQLVFQGRGEAAESGISRAIELAGQRALLNLH